MEYLISRSNDPYFEEQLPMFVYEKIGAVLQVTQLNPVDHKKKIKIKTLL